ncbi:hypothetical protein [Pseudomonas sp. NPDC086251]|uniref:hypothetical protein n=1 Tax=Pseudomonas sp. NPDC086251 TaxID=3364431 RepID=UPI003838934D
MLHTYDKRKNLRQETKVYPANENDSSTEQEETVYAATNLPKYFEGVKNMMITARVMGECGFDPEIETELLSEKLLSLSAHDRAELAQFDDVFDVATPYEFKDLAKNSSGGNDHYAYDKKRSLLMGRALTKVFGDKTLSFHAPSVKVGDLSVKPLASNEYEAGVPFLLSCKPNFCDFVGGFGGNYPASEYMTNKAISMKIYHKEKYVGHFNLWETAECDFIIGTIAVPRNTKIVDYEKKQRALLNKFSIDLLNRNPGAHTVYIGLGGANMATIDPKAFGFSDDPNSGYELVKKIRHEDNLNDPALREDVKRFKELSRFEIAGGIKLAENHPELHDEYYMGMAADERKDFKNAVVYATSDKLEELLPSIDEASVKAAKNAKKNSSIQAALSAKAERAARWQKK